MPQVDKTPVNVMFEEHRKIYGVTTAELSQYGTSRSEAIDNYCKAESVQCRGHILFSDCEYILFEPTNPA